MECQPRVLNFAQFTFIQVGENIIWDILENWVVLFKHFFRSTKCGHFSMANSMCNPGQWIFLNQLKKISPRHGKLWRENNFTPVKTRWNIPSVLLQSFYMRPARDCQIVKQLLMSNASFERLNKNTVKWYLYMVQKSMVLVPPPKV